MSRDYISDVPEDVAWSMRRTWAALERIADTLDDYMEMSLSGIEVTNGLKAVDPDVAEMLAPLTDALVAIRKRRADREAYR